MAEGELRAPEVVRDIVIGMSDGLTVPFALAAGLAGAVASTSLIVTAGLAEIAAGSIAMGLGGYLAVHADHEYYMVQEEEQRQKVKDRPHQSKEEVQGILQELGIQQDHVASAVEEITQDHKNTVSFLMKYGLRLDAPRTGRARNSSLTIGMSYIAGGLVPLFPYMVTGKATIALWSSVILTLMTLFAFGYAKGRFLGGRPWKGAVQMAVLGGLAAAVAFLAARFIA